MCKIKKKGGWQRFIACDHTMKIFVMTLSLVYGCTRSSWESYVSEKSNVQHHGIQRNILSALHMYRKAAICLPGNRRRRNKIFARPVNNEVAGGLLTRIRRKGNTWLYFSSSIYCSFYYKFPLTYLFCEHFIHVFRIIDK